MSSLPAVQADSNPSRISPASQLSAVERTDLDRLEVTIERGLGTFVEVGQALLRIRTERLYRADHGTFEDYCRERWSLKQSHVYRLMDAACIVGTLKSSPIGEVLPANEAQARPLATLPKEDQPIAWARAVEASGGRPTARHVEAAVQEMRPEPVSIVLPASEGQAFVGWSRDDFEQPQPAVEAPEERGLRFVMKILSGLGTLKDAGGMKALSRGWSPKDKRKTLNLIRSVVATLNEWCAELKGGAP